MLVDLMLSTIKAYPVLQAFPVLYFVLEVFLSRRVRPAKRWSVDSDTLGVVIIVCAITTAVLTFIKAHEVRLLLEMVALLNLGGIVICASAGLTSASQFRTEHPAWENVDLLVMLNGALLTALIYIANVLVIWKYAQTLVV